MSGDGKHNHHLVTYTLTKGTILSTTPSRWAEVVYLLRLTAGRNITF